jgi:ATP-dependent helicase HrpA
MIFPGSGLFDKAGRWVVAAEMVETSRLFARTVANIDSEWLEELGPNLCKRVYLNPHWERNRGEVVAAEQVSLFGLIIVAERSVSYGPINPEEATEIFIQSAIMGGDLKKPFGFMKHNQRLIDDIQADEDRLRRRDILISDADMRAFYQQHLKHIYSLATLSKYLKKRGGDQFLRLKRQDLMRYDPAAGELCLYPQSTDIAGQNIEYGYHFAPGEDDDGVTIKVPISLTPAVERQALDWLVPGLFKEKIEALIKGLPKGYRKKLVPVNETVEIISREMPRVKRALLSVLGEFILERFGVDIPASAWPLETLPDHLKMRIAVIAADGKELFAARDTAVLAQQKIKTPQPDEFESLRLKWEKTGLTRWDFGDLPDYVSSPKSVKVKWVAYPALADSDESQKGVRLKLFRHADKAAAAHPHGVAALYKIHFTKDLKFLKKGLKLPKQLKAAADYFGGTAKFEQRLLDRVSSDLFCKNIRSQDAFYAHADAVSAIILSHGQELLHDCLPVLSAYHHVRKEIDKLKLANLDDHAAQRFFKDLIEELRRLVPESFVTLYETERLGHIERYIKSMEIRAQRALVDYEKDQAKTKGVKKFTDSLDALIKELSADASDEKRRALEEFFWMIEEYKVSVFAQELKTAFPVSKKRLEKKLAELNRMA